MQCPAAFSFALCLRSIEQRSASPNVLRTAIGAATPGSICHQVIIAAQNRLDVKCGASRGVGIRRWRLLNVVGFLPGLADANPASKLTSLSFRFAVLLRSVGDLVLQVAGLMIAAELAERRLVQLKQNFAELLGFGIAGCETLS